MAEIRDNRISFLRIIAGFLPLVFGCFLSVVFQRIHPVVAKDLMTDLSIGEVALGISTAASLLSFAACLLPSGVAIDRFGPWIVQTVMMGVTALGALMISLSTGAVSLTAGRMLVGAGIASALLAGLKAVVTWCPPRRIGLATGGLMAVVGLGALAATDPAALVVRAYGWGTLFISLAALAMVCAILSALLVLPSATVTDDVPEDHGWQFVMRDPLLARFALLVAVVVGTAWAMNGHWVAGWLAAANGVELNQVTAKTNLIALGQITGSLLLGGLADWSVRKGLSTASVLVGAVAFGICSHVVAVGGIGWSYSIVWGAAVASAAVMLPYVVLLTHFPQGCAARACASIGVLQVVATLFIQSAMTIIVAIWPHAASAQTSATAYAVAFMVPTVLQFAALAWFLFARSETDDEAENLDEIAVAFASLRSAVHASINDLQQMLLNPMQRRGDARARPQEQNSPEPASPRSLAADDAAAPAGSAGEPAQVAAASAAPGTAAVPSSPDETVETSTETPAGANVAAEPADEEPADIGPADPAGQPVDTAPAPTGPVAVSTEAEEAGAGDAPASADLEEPADAAGAPAGMVAAPENAAVERADGPVAPRETGGALTEAALRSILDAPLGAGPGGVPDTTLRADADAPGEAVASAETVQPSGHELSFPQVAPSHVQALNAVYRRRPPLTTTIGGRQISIVAAWTPDRRRDANQLATLRLDGEPGEVWLPQSLLDLLVGSVDPALSLDRLGPARAAIILEYVLDRVLTELEMNLGCKLAIDSLAGRARRTNDDGQLPLSFTLVIEGLGTTGCELRIPPAYALRLADALDRHAGLSRSALDLPVPVCLRVAAANLAVSEIERLSSDDVVLVEASLQPGHALIAVIGERFVAPVAVAPDGLRLAAHPIHGVNSPWAWSLPTDAAWEADAETDNRPMHVLFEIGRFELPASKVKQLAPNVPLPLGPPHDQSVDIVVGGQRIGRGTLMRIGNRTGVRIDSVRQRTGSKRAPA